MPSTKKAIARQCRFFLLGKCVHEEAEMIHMGRDPDFPPRFSSREQIGDPINLPVAHSIAEPSACKSFISPSSPPNWAMPCTLLLTILLLHGKRNPTWDRTSQGLPRAGTCMISLPCCDHCSRGWCTIVALNSPRRLQRETQQWCTVFNIARCGKWRGDKWTLCYNIKNVTPFGNT